MCDVVENLEMKRILIVLLLLCCVTFRLGAQQQIRHEFSMGYSVGNNMADKKVNDVVDHYLETYHMESTMGCSDIIGDSHITMSFEYHYRLNQRWAVGCIAGWGLSNESYEGIEEQHAEQKAAPKSYLAKHGTEQSRIFFISPSVRYSWLTIMRGHMQLYSRVALGTIRQHMLFDYQQAASDGRQYTALEDDTQRDGYRQEHFDEVRWQTAYQLTPVGIDLGNRFIHFYSELGYGFLGIFTIGMRFTFP